MVRNQPRPVPSRPRPPPQDHPAPAPFSSPCTPEVLTPTCSLVSWQPSFPPAIPDTPTSRMWEGLTHAHAGTSPALVALVRVVTGRKLFLDGSQQAAGLTGAGKGFVPEPVLAQRGGNPVLLLDAAPS